MNNRLLFGIVFCTLSAMLYADEYSCKIVSQPGGTVTATQTDEDTYSLTAEPEFGWTFVEWENNNTSPTRSVDGAGDKVTFTATFEDHRCALYDPIYANPASGGTVTATQPDVSCECEWRITATPDAGWRFIEWSDHNTDNPRDITITDPTVPSVAYTARFEYHPCYGLSPTVTSPVTGGTAEATQDCPGIECVWTLTATPSDCYRFVKWSDNNTDNPRSITINPAASPVTYTPVFELLTPSVSSPVTGGTAAATQPGGYEGTCNWQLTATADTEHCYEFVQWSDGNTDNPRNITLDPSAPVVYRPIFEKPYCSYKATLDNNDGGTVTATLTDAYCCEWRLTATPADGWIFKWWDDDHNITNPVRSVVADDELHIFNAVFEDHRCELHEPKYDNPASGGTVAAEKPCTNIECEWRLTATPTSGYRFMEWKEDGNMDNPRDISLDPTEDDPITYTAVFVPSDGCIDAWASDKVIVRTNQTDLTGATAAIYTNRASQGTGLTVTKVDWGYWSIPASLNSYAGQHLRITFTDACDRLIAAIDTVVPYVSATTANISALSIPEGVDIQVVSDTLTFDATSTTIGALDIYADAKAVVPTGKTLNVNSITMRGDGINNKYPQLVANGAINNANDSIYYDYTLNYSSFYPLAVPYDVVCADIRTRTGKAASYEVQWYNGADRACNAPGWTVFNDTARNATLVPGTGYIMFAVPYKWNRTNRQSSAVVRFPMEANLTGGELEKRTTVSQYGNEGTNASNKNWNLIGNPYLANYKHGDDERMMVGSYEADTTANFETQETGRYNYKEENVRYITSGAGGFREYSQTRVEDVTMLAFNSYFIQAATSGDLVFTLSGRRQNAPRRYAADEQTAEEIEVGIVLRSTQHEDNAGLLYGEAFTDDYELNADLVKMFGDEQGMTVYTLAGNEERAFNALAMSCIGCAVPVGFRNATDGELTFAFDSERYEVDKLDAVMLTDYETGRITNLLEENYHFTTNVSQNDQRFVLSVIRVPQVVTDIVSPAASDGQSGRRVYDILGRLVGDTSDLPSGVYIIVENGESRKEVIR